jgi:diguanylate cyclase (GGDEF)-like protein
VSGRLRAVVLWSAGLACSGLLVVLAVDPLGPHATTLISDVVKLAVPLLVAAPCCAKAAETTSGRHRWSWGLIGGGCALWGLGQVVATWYEIAADTDPFPTLADAGFLLSVPFVVAGVACHPASMLRLGRLRVVVDGAIITFALLFAAAGSFFSEVWNATDGTVFERTLLTAYPAGDVLAVAVAMALIARRPAGLRGTLGALIAGMCSLAVADAAYCWLEATGTHQDELTDLGWPVGFLLIGVAAHRSIGKPDELGSGPRPTSLLEAWLPQAPIALASVVLLGRGLSGEGIGPALGLVAAVLLALVVLRQALVQLENGELTTVLERTVQTLEAREDELEYQAFHDPLTGLANRSLFRDRLQHATARRAGEVAVVFVDLDDFKTVNDTMGHEVGDRLLILVAERLSTCVRAGDTVARLGGDEFAVLIDDGGNEAATELAGRVLEALEAPFDLEGREFRARASIGVVTGNGLSSADELLQDADLAMYAAKGSGGSRVEAFDPTMRDDARHRLDLLGDLDHVIDRDELELHHQPIVLLSTGEVCGHETLLRWRHPERGLLWPWSFIDLAEEAGHIVAMGWWVLEESCRRAAERPDCGWVSVNVSVRQLHDPEIVTRVEHALAASGLEPERLVLEVTEHALAEGDDLVARMRAVRELGVRIAIDDFGTGYSSLAALAGLPLDALKIDGSFVAGLDSPEGEVLARAIVELASALGLSTIAEGVEHRWQLEKVRALGCDAAQGFLLGRPDPVPRPVSAVRAGQLDAV